MLNPYLIKLSKGLPGNIHSDVHPYTGGSTGTFALILEVIEPIPRDKQYLWNDYLRKFTTWREGCRPRELNPGPGLFGIVVPKARQKLFLESPFIQGFQWLTKYMCPQIAHEYDLPEATFLRYYHSYEDSDWDKFKPDQDSQQLAVDLFKLMVTRRHWAEGNACRKPDLTPQGVGFDKERPQEYGEWIEEVQNLMNENSTLKAKAPINDDLESCRIKVRFPKATRPSKLRENGVTILVVERCDKAAIIKNGSSTELTCPKNKLVFLDCLWWALDHLSSQA